MQPQRGIEHRGGGQLATGQQIAPDWATVIGFPPGPPWSTMTGICPAGFSFKNSGLRWAPVAKSILCAR
jgi:hypothetical protein